MTRIILTLCIAFIGFFQVSAQKINNKIDQITFKIDSITNQERKLLKVEIKDIEKRYNNDEITYEKAQNEKEIVTNKHASNIKNQITQLEDELHVLIQERVNDRLTNPNRSKTVDIGMKSVVITDKDGVVIKRYGKNKYSRKKNARTYSNMVLAFGLNNLMTDGDINSIQDAPYEFGGSQFFELGLNYKTRILKESSLLYFDYGLSVRYNKLRPKDNKYFVTNGDVTTLEEFEHNYKKATFKNVQLVVPMYLEFDFSKPKMVDDKKVFRRNNAFRFGIGGFAGINLKSKQKIIYKLDGKRKKDRTVGDFNVNRFVYGLNTYIGYKDTSFYVKYDLNDLFDDNFKDQHNFSFGVKFDL